jgi:hypothetical protein
MLYKVSHNELQQHSHVDKILPKEIDMNLAPIIFVLVLIGSLGLTLLEALAKIT